MKLISILLLALLVSCSQREDVKPATNPKAQQLAKLSSHISELKSKNERDHNHGPEEILGLEEKLMQKRLEGSLAYVNHDNLAVKGALEGHTKVYEFKGEYKVMVIPVQFSDEEMADPSFFKENTDGVVPAQEYIFGKDKNSMAQYYLHASMGKLKVKGEVTPIVTVNGTLKDYGEAVQGGSDKNARGLVVDALVKLKQIKTDTNWWYQFDEWDLNDYDQDKNFHEADGFVDAVVLIYAGKSQASCQRAFDPDGERPASSDVPEGPQKLAAVECFNRIWPHRWSIHLSESHPEYSKQGPIIEGTRRPSMGGLKIADDLFAVDYNMQSEFSDRSTFIHEFGHSLTLPDIYSSGKGNSTGQWEIMSSNSNLQAQEFSSFSKISLGWLKPKVVKQGTTTSAYLGAYNFLSHNQREDLFNFDGPLSVEDLIDGRTQDVSIVSQTPRFDEPVYRSLAIITDPTIEEVAIVEDKFGDNNITAYSSRFDGDSRSVKVSLTVPETGDATLKFDTIYHIETETNFKSKTNKEIKVVVDYDLGKVIIDGETKEELRTISGDNNYDTLNEMNPICEATRVLELREKLINNGDLDEAEKLEFTLKTNTCQKPTWVTKEYDLSDKRGQTVEVEINLTTDGGYTEFGVLVDNIRLGSELIDFQDKKNLGTFKALKGGSDEAKYQQFYLMEYRTPGENFQDQGLSLSYNMDNNISDTQSVFINSDKSLKDRFRLLEASYQPGVVVWYFNNKFDRRSNNAHGQKGKGYYLVLNSKVQEMILPGGIFDNVLTDNGEYDPESDAHKALETEQQRLFVCFAWRDYYVYQNGSEENCNDVADLDYISSLTLNGKRLQYRRERFNELLPIKRYSTYGVGKPFRSSPAMRTSLSAFRPEGSPAVKPFKVYKRDGQEMVLDTDLTNNQKSYEAVSSFKDANSKLTDNDRFHGDSVVVEKKGLSFKVVKPSPRVEALYSRDEPADSSANYYRRPRAKVLIDWEE